MSREKHDECGIVAVQGDAAGVKVFYSLRVIQHRGQEAAGIAVFNNGVKCVRGMGLVHEVFSVENLQNLEGRMGIGHVRYSTTGTSCIENAQPVVVSSVVGDIALAHNGDIVNAASLREELRSRGWAFITTTDSEVIIRLLANELARSKDVVVALRNMMKTLVGSYSLVILAQGRIYGVRDPLGIKPLCLGRIGDMFGIASESVVFDTLDAAEFVRDVQPGEIVEVSENGLKSYVAFKEKFKAHCMFEWVYFARPDSVIDGRTCYEVRKEIGRVLAKEHPMDADLVMPVPDSGRIQALGFAEGSGIRFSEGLMKNRYIERTFIIPDQKDREINVFLKLNPFKSVIGGKNIVLVDDSIVRGTTMKKIVEVLRKGGAKKVHLRIGCPPIVAPCPLGIDMKTRDQFIAVGKSFKEIARELGADSVGYISIPGLVKAIGKDVHDLCLGCLTGEYPVKIPGERIRSQERLDAFMKV